MGELGETLLPFPRIPVGSRLSMFSPTVYRGPGFSLLFD